MACNLVYAHLLRRLQHEPECDQACVDGCRAAEFEAWLEQPLTQWEAAAEDRFRERRQALARGEIPA